MNCIVDVLVEFESILDYDSLGLEIGRTYILGAVVIEVHGDFIDGEINEVLCVVKEYVFGGFWMSFELSVVHVLFASVMTLEE